MAHFDVVRRTALTAGDAWLRLTDWELHSHFIPFTTVRLTTSSSAGVGCAFVARTSLGPVAFDDPMEVTVSQTPDGDAPGFCRIVKRGRAVTGWAQLTVAQAPGGALVHWHEEAQLRAVGHLLDWPNSLVGRLVFGRLVDGLLSQTRHGRL